jgi:hypothetical protein
MQIRKTKRKNGILLKDPFFRVSTTMLELVLVTHLLSTSPYVISTAHFPLPFRFVFVEVPRIEKNLIELTFFRSLDGHSLHRNE